MAGDGGNGTEAMFAKVFNLSPLYLVITSQQTGKLLQVNDVFCELSGYSREEALGKSPLELGLWVDVATYKAGYQQLMEQGSIEKLEVQLRSKNGEIRTYMLSSVLTDLQGEEVILNAALDITESKQSQERASQLATILEDSSNEIYLFDAASLRFTLVNRGARTNLGYSAQELAELTPLDLKPEFDRKQFETLLLPLRSGEEDYITFETVHRRKDGTNYPVEVHLQLVQTSAHPVFVAIILDITERKQAEAETAFQASLLDNLFDTVIVTDTDQYIQVWNRRAEQLFGYSKAQAIGKRPRDLIGSTMTEEQRLAASRSMQEQGFYRLETQITDHQGQIHALDSVNVALPDHKGQVTYLSIARDITERKQAEKALQALNEDLEAKVSERTKEVQELAGQLGLTEQKERQALATTLHDTVQQELYGMQFALSNLKRKFSLPQDDPGVIELDTLLRTVMQVTRNITKDLNPPILDDRDLCKVLQWLALSMEERYGLKVHVLGIESCDLESRAMRTFVFTLCRELLFNIVKHAEANEAWLTIDLSDERLTLSIKDEGKGFVLDQTLHGGTGLGLSGAHKRLQMFGGRIEIDSALNQGTLITIQLPTKAFIFS
ncbi:MAG: PAS domain S-box protein [Trueperaceae bacterium]|nr:PAS domain S-box protein [Trueperaceae bacterium]